METKKIGNNETINDTDTNIDLQESIKTDVIDTDKYETCKCCFFTGLCCVAGGSFIVLSKLAGWCILKTCCNPAGMSKCFAVEGKYVFEQTLVGAVAITAGFGATVDKSNRIR